MSIFKHFEHLELTNDQHQALQKIEHFLHGNGDVFILKGYAGTGKTTLLKGIIQFINYQLKHKNRQLIDEDDSFPANAYQLMAPTGRAAKVIHNKTGFPASTIHKGIYNFEVLKIKEVKDKKGNDTYKFYYDLRSNAFAHNILIIDEASMISNVQAKDTFFEFGSGFLLKDLIRFAGYSLNKKTKIIFTGDPAQLPPVDMNFSPALSKEYLQRIFNLDVNDYEMTEVVRQNSTSGILKSATLLRNNLIPGGYKRMDVRANEKDIFNIKPEDFYSHYKNIPIKDKISITYTNKKAYQINEKIRNKRFNNTTNSILPIQQKDIIIVSVNNYLYNVMNGEFGFIKKADKESVTRKIPYYLQNGEKDYINLTWRKVELLFDNNKVEDLYILENALYSRQSNLSDEERQALFVDFKIRMSNEGISDKDILKEKLKKDPYFNALQIKYGYAITCHKAQGGEWKNVFVDFSDFSQGQKNETFYKWTYTAITRSNDKLIAIQPPYFHSFSEMTWIPVEIQETLDDAFGKKTIEIKFNEQHQKKLNELSLKQMHPAIQNQALKLWESVKPAQIDLVYFDQINYELRFGFQRGEEKATFKFWINGRNEIKDKFQKINQGTNSDELFEEISGLIKDLNHINIIRDNEDSSINNQTESIEIPDEFPVLKNLYDSLQKLLPTNIQIDKVVHHPYLERYRFIRNNEKALVDFHYNNKAFFGKVVPQQAHCNSNKLLQEIEQTVNKLKQ